MEWVYIQKDVQMLLNAIMHLYFAILKYVKAV